MLLSCPNNPLIVLEYTEKMNTALFSVLGRTDKAPQIKEFVDEECDPAPPTPDDLTHAHPATKDCPNEKQTTQPPVAGDCGDVEKPDECISNDDERGEVAAIRYNGCRKWWTVWWVGFLKPDRKIFKDLDGIDASKLDEARQKQGKRIKLTGARYAAVGSSERTDRSMVPATLSFVSVRRFPVKYQAKDSFCALNSVANAVDLPQALYDAIRAEGRLFPLKGVMSIVNQAKAPPCQLHKIKAVQRTNLRSWLLKQTEGVFAVEFKVHCVT